MKPDPDRRVLGLAKSILKKYAFCPQCLGRQFPHFQAKLTSRQKGQELLQLISNKARRPENCYLCGGLMSSIEERSMKIVEALKPYEFDSFLVGTKVPTESIEREDLVRSEFKLRGGRTLKAEFTRELGRNVATLMGKELTYTSPELVAILDPVDDSIKITPKSLHMFGRYVKKVRGLPQKQTFSKDESVESLLAGKILGYFGGRKVRFSWIGGEDDDSLVLAEGRPFYAELFEPTRRSLDAFSKLSSEENRVVLKELRIVKGTPPVKVKFRVKILADVEFESPITEDELSRLELDFKDTVVTALSTRKGKLAEKKIYTLKIEEFQGKTARLMIECDGGLNIKKFVSGADHEVSPSISEVIRVGTRCSRFDVLEVNLL